MLKSAGTAIFIALAIQMFTIGILAPKLPREVCPPGIQSNQTFTFSAAPIFRLENKDGTIRVQVNPVSEKVQIIARVRAYTAGADSQAVAEAYLPTLFKVEETAEMIRLITEPGIRPDTVDMRVDYTVEVPQNTDISIDVANGNVWISEGCSNISVVGNNSDIEIIKPFGTVSAKTVNGRISVLESTAETTLETVNGSVQTSLAGGALQASTITGNILASLLDEKVESCDLTSLNGSITLVMSDKISVDMNAATECGLVRTDVTMEPWNGIKKRRQVYGRIGNGETPVSVNSMNGDIVIQRSAT